ncbi:MAG: class A beta-lactamase-related serine hydrolase [Syntrophaceticus sp.]|nr:class A beta-lactamase-related serine hydrolase [Syntrophaceticus sp.]MDD4782400.1 class A beta-lactamase-related serine hydrolase [Syntrophaceticus sp.]
MPKRKRVYLVVALLAFVMLVFAVGQVIGPQELKPLHAKPDYQPLQEEVARFTANFPGTYGIYFKDLESGEEFGINAQTAIPPASSIKLPVVLYLYEQVADGKLNWTDRVRYNKNTDYQGGAGDLQYVARHGDTYSLRNLATISITLSDNIAHNMLVRHLGYDNVMEFINKLGPDTTRPFGSASTTARDMGAFVEEVYRFAEQNPDQGGRLINDLAHTVYHVGLPGDLPPELVVPHKEGSINGVATDAGIVFSRKPYILVVLSKGVPDEDTGFENIAKISRIIYDHQQQLPEANLRLPPLE